MMTGVTLVPKSERSLSQSCILRTVAKTCQPDRTIRETEARPIPLDAPVITTVFLLDTPINNLRGPYKLFMPGRPAKNAICRGAKNLGCFANLLDRLQKLQQVVIDFVLVCGREAVRSAGI